MIILTPLTDIPELHDPAITGEWAPAFAAIVTMRHDPPWCSYLASRDGEPVATGGFKGAPQDGCAEIAYLTFLPARGQGVATEVAGELARIAEREGVPALCAHTLPEANASTKVLQANGFTQVGEIVDPEDGPVWRWERQLRPAAE